MNKETIFVGSTDKKVWCKPVVKVVELDAADIIATSGDLTESYDEEDYNPWVGQ